MRRESIPDDGRRDGGRRLAEVEDILAKFMNIDKALSESQKKHAQSRKSVERVCNLGARRTRVGTRSFLHYSNFTKSQATSGNSKRRHPVPFGSCKRPNFLPLTQPSSFQTHLALADVGRERDCYIIRLHVPIEEGMSTVSSYARYLDM